MSDPKPPAPKADALAKELKASLAKRRPRPWKAVLATLIAAIVLLALIVWWLYPRPRSLPLQLVGLDTICTPDDTPTARAQLLAPPLDPGPRRLSGHTVVFRDAGFVAAPGAKPRTVIVKSDERGQASTDWPLNPLVTSEFLAQHIDSDERQGSPQEPGRIFVWLKDSALLIVDADETLIAEELDAKAGEVLSGAGAENWRIVYLALAHTGAHDFRKTRGWIDRQAKLPKGPVLGRPTFESSESSQQIRRELLKGLQGTFSGKMVAIVKNAESARTCNALNVRTVVVGAQESPTWAEVASRLK